MRPPFSRISYTVDTKSLLRLRAARSECLLRGTTESSDTVGKLDDVTGSAVVFFLNNELIERIRNLEMDLPLTLEVLVLPFELFFVGRLLGQTSV